MQSNRGGISVLAALSMVVVCTFALAAFSLGRVVSAKQDAQRAADAAAVAAADAYREEGRAASFSAAQQVGRSILKQTVQAEVELSRPSDPPGRFTVDATSTVRISLPRMLNPAGIFDLQSRAQASGDQWFEPSVTLETADLCEVLDVSGSMGGDRMDNLKKGAVAAIERMKDKVNFAGVLFSSDVVDFQPFDGKNAAPILEKKIQNANAGGGTETDKGLEKGAELFEEEWQKEPSRQDSKKFILLVSDGEPSDAAAAEAVVRKLWSADEYKKRPSVYTLHIGNDGAEFMKAVSGPPYEEGSKTKREGCQEPDCWNGYYYQVNDASELTKALGEIVEQMLCHAHAPPVAATVEEPRSLDGGAPVHDEATLRAFLVDKKGGEVPLPRTASPEQLARFPDEYGIYYAGGKARFTEKTCKALGDGAGIVYRYNHSRLVQ